MPTARDQPGNGLGSGARGQSRLGSSGSLSRVVVAGNAFHESVDQQFFFCCGQSLPAAGKGTGMDSITMRISTQTVHVFDPTADPRHAQRSPGAPRARRGRTLCSYTTCQGQALAQRGRSVQILCDASGLGAGKGVRGIPKANSTAAHIVLPSRSAGPADRTGSSPRLRPCRYARTIADSRRNATSASKKAAILPT